MSSEFGEGYGTIRGELVPFMDYQSERGTSKTYQSEDYIEFQSLSDTISSNIFQINSNVQALERICKQLGNQLKEVPYDKLHRIQQGTNKLATETTMCYKKMAKLSGGSDMERRHQRLQQERLKDEFEDSISRYQNVQKKLAEKSKYAMNSTVVKFSHRSEGGYGDEDSDKTRLLSEDRDSQQKQQQQMEDEISFDQSLLEERERMMRQLESDVLDVNEIFRDLALMVHEQGEVVDSIEGHVIGAHSDVENAREELQKASVYQKRARKKKCCLLLILLLVLGIIGLIIYLETK